MQSNRAILATATTLVLTILFFGTSDLDWTIQDMVFNFETHKWILDKHAEPYASIFYSGLKNLLLIFAIAVLLVSIVFRNHPSIKSYKRGTLILVLSAIVVPLVTGGIKRYSNMPCPKHEIHYGGEYPKTAVWESYKPPYEKLDTIKCWPAGHASGGFALMSLFFLFRRRRNRYFALGTALAIGWSMGTYKMLIGDHFFSHTFITMVLSWLIILIIARMVNRFTTS